jgi:ribonuclease P protein component
MLSAQYRLRKQKDFDIVYSKGRIVFGPLFNVRFLNIGSAPSKFAFVVSKKTEKTAVGRNRIKRRLREVVQRYITTIKPGFDIVINIKRSALSASYEELEKSFLESLKKSRLLSHG